MPDLPTDQQLWDAEECAQYLKQKRPYFLRVTRWRRGFPGALPQHPRPRWSAAEVVRWALGREQ